MEELDYFGGDKSKGLVPACENCHLTRTTKAYIIKTNLVRTEEELKRTLAILEK